MSRNVHNWLFVLAAVQDDVTRYYACVAICIMASDAEGEAAISGAGTLDLVLPFLHSVSPKTLAFSDYHHSKFRPKAWLSKLLPLLNAKRKESRSLAAFHFAMEAAIKEKEDECQIFTEIGAIAALKSVASRPEESASRFARMALEIIGEEAPYKLTQQVPLWTVQDVGAWVSQVAPPPFSFSLLLLSVDWIVDRVRGVRGVLRA